MHQKCMAPLIVSGFSFTEVPWKFSIRRSEQRAQRTRFYLRGIFLGIEVVPHNFRLVGNHMTCVQLYAKITHVVMYMLIYAYDYIFNSSQGVGFVEDIYVVF